MERHLAQLAAELDDPEAISPIASDAWTIFLDEDIDIQLRLVESGGALLHCDLGACPDETDALERLLLANFSGLGTLGAVLGIGVDEKRVTLKSQVAASCTYRELREALEDFYNCALFWTKEIPTLSAAKDLQAFAQRKAVVE